MKVANPIKRISSKRQKLLAQLIIANPHMEDAELAVLSAFSRMRVRQLRDDPGFQRYMATLKPTGVVNHTGPVDRRYLEAADLFVLGLDHNEVAAILGYGTPSYLLHLSTHGRIAKLRKRRAAVVLEHAMRLGLARGKPAAIRRAEAGAVKALGPRVTARLLDRMGRS